MSGSAAQFKQDMPPPGGYGPINFRKVPAKRLLSGYAIFGGYVGITLGAFYLYTLNYKSVRARELEMKSASFAIYPMLLAERDRAFLKQLRRNRDEEADLMKNVEGWKTGTWYGEPIYQTLEPDTLIEPMAYEFFVHGNFKDFSKRALLPYLS
ncbi:NADH dehydrogenase [ubiquinone] 1 alpha subcomplex subunit 13 [Cylas formicarius]|uniref:NADH dehydrogenase [ubiquinone] 1 alpha subcomplex subunit 13 n=1 Tax=Cylas formicarius TaxID=197179 RepID=UPI0029583A1F|nr:NADH dehydrogenase [ubiquinone] 1 alpha subcomplex subunit 13 [Cylas formicarius]